MRKEKVLLVDVMGTDCTNRGVTSGRKNAYVLHKEGPFEVDLDDPTTFRYPVLEFCKGPYDSVNFKPLDHEKKWYMFGGHFVHSSDSRFSEAFGRRPVHVHDRFEK